jgi:hypothetical protein
MSKPTAKTTKSTNPAFAGLRGDPFEEFLLRVSVSRGADHRIRLVEVMADVGLSFPDPPVTVEEMQLVTFAAKMALLKILRKRKSTKKEM